MLDRKVGYHSEEKSPKLSWQEREAMLPREIETKIIEEVDFDDLQRRLIESGAELLSHNTPIRDTTYKLAKENKERGAPSEVRVLLAGIPMEEREKFRQALGYMKLAVKEFLREEGDDFYIVRRPPKIPKRAVRIRRTGDDQIFFTVKKPREKDLSSGIDNRPEIEVPLANPDSIDALLEAIGYHRDQQEKYVQRTSYQAGDVKFEFNTAPHLDIPPWLEIEGISEEAIRDAARRFGISESFFRSMSLREQIEYFKKTSSPTEIKSE